MLRKTLTGALFLAAAAALTAAPNHAEGVHFGLRSSAPEAESTVSSVEEIRLWFTQVPQENSVSVRLINGSGDALETSDIMRDEADGKIIFVTLDAAPPAGAYTVAWRGIGDDGHVVRGDFPFTVSAER